MLEQQDPRSAEENQLLRALPADRYAELLPYLEPVDLAVRQVLWQPNATLHSIYFPRTAVLSLLTLLADAEPVEAATIGREGMAGSAILLGARVTGVQAIVQLPGTAVRVDADRFLEYLGPADGAVLPLLLRHAQALQEQTAQTVACNRRHDIEERCARWLLMTQDRVGKDQFGLTQDFLAYMLGVRRASVTVAAGMLQRAGLIRYSRGRITVVDREGLEAASCECYAVVRQRYDNLLGAQAPSVGLEPAIAQQ